MREAKYCKSLTVALSEEVFQKIKAITDQERISMAEWIREIVDNALKNINIKEEENHER